MDAPSRDSGVYALRVAAEADLDEIASVAVAAFPDDPEFDYRFPYRDEYPEDHWKWTRREYKGYLAQRSKYAVLVVVTEVATEKGSVSKVIALGVWDVAVNVKPTGDGIDSGIDQRRDANIAHMREFTRSMDKGFDCFFSDYGKKQLHLWLLATHPHFRRHGAGTMLCRWGLEQANARGWAATVLGSPMGSPLYKSLGFHSLGSVVTRIAGEEEQLETSCMVYDNRPINSPKASFFSTYSCF